MNHFRNVFNVMLLIFGLIFFFIVEVAPNMGKSVTIDRFDAEITLDEQGDMTVVERWDMDYHQDMRVRFRDIKYNKYAPDYPLIDDDENRATWVADSVDVDFYHGEFNRTSLIRIGLSTRGDQDELGYTVRCLDDSSECESIFVDANNAGRLKGKVSFIYTYTIEGVITKYSDISELNWRLFEYAEGTVKTATITLHMPSNSYDIDRFYAWGHGLSSGNIEIQDNRTVKVTMKNIKNGEFPELRVLMPNLLFPNMREHNIVIHPNMDFETIFAYENALAITTNRRSFIAQIMFFGAFALIPLMGFLTYRIYLKHDKEYEAEFQGDFFRELPNEATPAEVSYLYYNQSIHDEVFTATLLDLIRRGYIKIKDEIKNVVDSEADLKLIRINPTQEKMLLPHEKVLLNMIFDMLGDQQETSTHKIEKFASNYSNAQAFQNKAKELIKEAKKQSEKQHYYESLTTEKSSISKYAMIPISFFGIAFILWINSAIDTWIAMGISIAITVSFLIYVHRFQRRTKQGNELYVKWKAFRNFLVNFSSMEDYPMPSIIIWEHYLVYATVFKLADVVMEQLRVKLPKEAFESGQSTYLGYGYRRYGSSHYYIHSSFSRSYQEAKTNAAQTIARHNQAQASSGRGGGFGGGSSFGGGGGGGRSR
jgi:uncharacterized membrane protein